MRFHVMTLFPEMFQGYMAQSIMKRGVESQNISVETYNIRDFSENKHKKVDDYPFGGGPGMLMTPQPIYSAYRHVVESKDIQKPRVVYLTPRGKVFNQKIADELSKEDDIIFLCGHYEGVDQRILDTIVTDEISIGDYILTGGELPALVMIDSISRLVEGVLGKEESHMDESFSDGLLEYDQYTRPREFMGSEVPQVLLSGNHKSIDEWRLENSMQKTLENRPDLLRGKKLSKKEIEVIRKIKNNL